MTKQITAGQVHKALVDSIELRWTPLAKGESIHAVPRCQLCDLFGGYMDNRVCNENCEKCPLHMIGEGCDKKTSAWNNYINVRYSYLENEKQAAARNMIRQLQKCLDTFFPGGLAEDI